MTPAQRRLLARLDVAVLEDLPPMDAREWATFVAERKREFTRPPEPSHRPAPIDFLDV